MLNSIRMVATKIHTLVSTSILLLVIVALYPLHAVSAQTPSEWNMAGGNPQRTSWVDADISGVTGIVWYRPIEAYIDQKTQIVTAHGNIYVATANGMVVLRATNGELVWRFNTELPLGHTPTIIGNTVYIGGYDRKLYALNAQTGQMIWTFTGAKAGYSVSPLVVNNTVYVGNRDGRFYAINASNGNLNWQFPAAGQEPLGAILDSAAYSSATNAVYFGSMNMRGYALNASNGQPLWFHSENGQQIPGSEKIPGMSIQSYWPIVYGDQVIFVTAHPFTDGNPGSGVLPGNVDGIIRFRDALYGTSETLRYSGDRVISDGSQGWPSGTQLLDSESNADPVATSIQEHLSANPTWRTTIALSGQTGQILSGSQNPPFAWTGTVNGSRHPLMINPQTGVAYNVNTYSKQGGGIPRARVMGWQTGNRYLSMMGDFAVDEPAIVSGAGSDVMINLCCDRIARILTRNRSFWSYDEGMLDAKLPSQNTGGNYTPNIDNRYDPMWQLASNNLERLTGYYKGTTTTPNGIYSSHGLQNPLIPYRFTSSQGQTVQRIFTHRSNTIIALGESSIKEYLEPVLIESDVDAYAEPLTESELVSRLEKHLDVMITSYEQQGKFLNPGYYHTAQGMPSHYFTSPAETLLVLSNAYQLLQNRGINPNLRNRLRMYAIAYYQQFLAASNTGNTGWQGVSRDESIYTPELLASMASRGPSNQGFSARDVYGLWKYAQTFSSNQAFAIYDRIKNNISIDIPPNPSPPNPPIYQDISDWNTRVPWAVNDFIAGYYGLLGLLDMTQYTATFCNQNPNNGECIKRNQVQSALNTLLNEKSSNFRKDQPIYAPWDNPNGPVTSGAGFSGNFKVLNWSRNFLFLTPELAAHFTTSIPQQVNQALNEYTYLGPFWYTSLFDNDKQERTMHNLYDIPYLFSAKAWIQGESAENLRKYIDIPAFPRGDLYYIGNIVTALEASDTSTPIPGDANGDRIVDGIDYVVWLTHYNQSAAPNDYSVGNFNDDSVVDGLDYVIWLSNYSG